jgi:ribonuclease-3
MVNERFPYSVIAQKLRYEFKRPELLLLAFTHSSYANEQRSAQVESNERLEFLGDAILCAAISSYLYQQCPHLSEGELSRVRSHLVSAESCRSYCQALGIEQYLRLGKGEISQGIRGRATILADLFEAVLGAIYLDSGYEIASGFILTHFKEEIDLRIRGAHQPNWKTILQQHAQEQGEELPHYQLLHEVGPDHQKRFIFEVYLQGRLLGKGEGKNKKEAQQDAAEAACKRLKLASEQEN